MLGRRSGTKWLQYSTGYNICLSGWGDMRVCQGPTATEGEHKRFNNVIGAAYVQISVHRTTHLNTYITRPERVSLGMAHNQQNANKTHWKRNTSKQQLHTQLIQITTHANYN